MARSGSAARPGSPPRRSPTTAGPECSGSHCPRRSGSTSSPSDRLAKALTLLGRVVKTTYLLRYAHDAQVRDRVHLQLNRGESRHALARRLFFANQGAFRVGDYEEIMNKVSALALISNAVLVWNTVRFAEIVAALERSSGQPVRRQDLARVSPLMNAHVIPSGTYHFDRVTPPAIVAALE
jgi:hypothetical protein